MAISRSRQNFLDSSDAENIRQILISMTESSEYSTISSLGIDDPALFVEKHLEYLSIHTNIDPEQYLSNLRLKSKIR